MDWRHHALCRDEDPELFFPIGNTGPALLQIEEAKQVCRRCDVRDACLQWALEAGQDHGVWGGLSEDERRVHRQALAGMMWSKQYYYFDLEHWLRNEPIKARRIGRLGPRNSGHREQHRQRRPPDQSLTQTCCPVYLALP